MTHYVLLQFAPGTDLDEKEALARETFTKLEQELEFLNDPVVYRNCVERDSNADLMVKLSLDSADQLQLYLRHPLHLAMAEKMAPDQIGRVSFDHE